MNWCNKLGFTCKIQFCVSSCFQFEAYPNKTGVCPHVSMRGDGGYGINLGTNGAPARKVCLQEMQYIL